MARFDDLMVIAKELEKHVDTEWAEEHESEYNKFADAIENAYFAEEITAKEHDELALTAFYDYFDLYADEKED